MGWLDIQPTYPMTMPNPAPAWLKDKLVLPVEQLMRQLMFVVEMQEYDTQYRKLMARRAGYKEMCAKADVEMPVVAEMRASLEAQIREHLESDHEYRMYMTVCQIAADNYLEGCEALKLKPEYHYSGVSRTGKLYETYEDACRIARSQILYPKVECPPHDVVLASPFVTA